MGTDAVSAHTGTDFYDVYLSLLIYPELTVGRAVSDLQCIQGTKDFFYDLLF